MFFKAKHENKLCKTNGRQTALAKLRIKMSRLWGSREDIQCYYVQKYDNFSSKHSFHSFFILRISKYCLFKDRLHYHFWPYIILPLSTGSCQTYVKYSINMTCSETCFRIHLQFIFGNKLFFRLLTIWLQKNYIFYCKKTQSLCLNQTSP